MPNKFLTTNIVDPEKAPISKRSLEHINSMSQLVGDAIVKGLLGSYTTGDLIVLSGCVVAVTSGAIPGTGTATLTAGYIYYNGDIYAVDANASLATTNPQTLVWVVDETYRSGDPATFQSGDQYDFHQYSKLKLQAGTAGSGIANYDGATVKYLRGYIKGKSDTIVSVVTVVNAASITTSSININRIGNMLLFSGRINWIVGASGTSSRVHINIPTDWDIDTTVPSTFIGTGVVQNQTGQAYKVSVTRQSANAIGIQIGSETITDLPSGLDVDAYFTGSALLVD